jgi:hypothetical protein
MKRVLCGVVIGLLVACQTQVIPASRLTGIIVTPEGDPIDGAFIELHLAVPVGVDGGELEELGAAWSGDDGTYEIAFPERRILVNYGERALYALGIVHPERQPVGSWFDEIPARLVRLHLRPREPGTDPIKEDCHWLCMGRRSDQCEPLALEYFGSEGVCDFLY